MFCFVFCLSPLAYMNTLARGTGKLGSIFVPPWRQNRTFNNLESDLVYKLFVRLEATQRVWVVSLLYQVIPGFTGPVQTSLKVFQG